MRSCIAVLLLSACTSPPPQPHAHDPLTWFAAIGRLDDDKDDSSCSATLITPDVIATAAHCVIFNGHVVDPASLTFYPNLGAASLPPSRGAKLIVLGPEAKTAAADLREKMIAASKDAHKLTAEDGLNASIDWALVQISPPITAVPPIQVGSFTAADIAGELAKGGALGQAGYGVYGLSLGTHLYQQDHCALLDDDRFKGKLSDYILFTSCRPIKGDSGGPLVLTKASGERYLVGVIAEYRFTEDSSNRITVAAGAYGFADQIPGAN